MVDQCPFLLNTLMQVDNNTSKQHAIFYHPQHECVSLLLNNSSDNKWFIFKIPFQSLYTIIPSLACSLMGYSRPIVPKFYHVLALRQVIKLQFDQSSQTFNYLPHFFLQHFECGSNYHIFQLKASFDVCAHITSTLWISTFYIVPMAMNA